MAWETRPRGRRPYYTRSRKVGGRVLREYVGGGPAGECAAARDARERAKRHAAQAAWQAERERYNALDGALADLDVATDALLRATLTAAGYHQHHRGEWRRSRD